MAPTQEHPAKYFSAHICPRPFWNPVKFQHYFKKSHHRQPPQILIDITCVFHIHFDSSLAQFGFCSPLIYDDRYEVRQVWQFRQIWQVWRVGHTAAEASSKGPAACEEGQAAQEEGEGAEESPASSAEEGAGVAEEEEGVAEEGGGVAKEYKGGAEKGGRVAKED